MDVDALTLNLVGTWTLEDVAILELHAGYVEHEAHEEDTEESAAGGTISFLDIEANPELGAVRFRFQATASMPGRLASVEVAPIYALHGMQVDEQDDDVLTNFVNKVAGMAAFPFLRAELADITRRVFGDPLVLPMIALNDLNFERVEEATQD